jgi:tetratricopeptide (TPR) repeat protein
MFAQDDETAALLRQATAHGDAKRWDKAIDCLEQASTRMAYSAVDYPIASWLKLPLYLQKAGRFDEALAVFDEIDAATPERVARHSGHLSAAVQAQVVAEQRHEIAAKRELAAKREAAASAKTNKKPRTGGASKEV